MKILIADDNAKNLYQLQVLLEAHGYEVITAADGAEALALARRAPPDLIISDILMPVMDGFSLCREWKKSKSLQAIPFIFYTATYTDNQDQRFALRLGAERFIVKPEDPELFIKVVQEVIQERQNPPRTIPAPAPAPPLSTSEDEAGYLREHNAALIRKLETKMEQLERVNRELQTDITARKQAEEALSRSERNYREVFNATNEAIFVYDASTGHVLDVNAAMLRMYGFGARDDALAISPSDLCANEQPYTEENAHRWLQRSVKEGPQTFDWLAKKQNGDRFWVEMSLRSTEIGGRPCILAVVRDISERKTAELRIQEQLKELQRWHTATLEREERILELKRQVNDLLLTSGQPPRYPSALPGDRGTRPDKP